MVTSSELAHEVEIVWIEDLKQFDYVREVRTLVRNRCGRPQKDLYPRLVGYANLSCEAEGTNWHFWRRVWYVMPHDRLSGQENAGPYYPSGAPSEAVDPRTVAVGVPGTMTPQAWGRKEGTS